MNRTFVRRIGAILLGLILLSGAASRALGRAACPMHIAAATTAEPHQHQDHPPTASVCDCLDACHGTGHPVVLGSSDPARAFDAGTTRWIGAASVIERLPGPRARHLPFATPPPLAV